MLILAEMARSGGLPTFANLTMNGWVTRNPAAIDGSPAQGSHDGVLLKVPRDLFWHVPAGILPKMSTTAES
jgi:hypothetical protein